MTLEFIVETLRAKNWGLFEITQELAGDTARIAQNGAVASVAIGKHYSLLPYSESVEEVLAEWENARYTNQPPLITKPTPFIIDGMHFADDGVYVAAVEFPQEIRVSYEKLESFIDTLTPYNPTVRAWPGQTRSEWN